MDARSPQDEIIRPDRETRREWTLDGEGRFGGGRVGDRLNGVADRRERNEAVQAMIAIGAPAGDVQGEIDLRRSESGSEHGTRLGAAPVVCGHCAVSNCGMSMTRPGTMTFGLGSLSRLASISRL